MLHIVVVAPATETLLANLSGDFPVNNLRTVERYTPHDLPVVHVFWNAFQRLATANAHLLSLDIFKD